MIQQLKKEIQIWVDNLEQAIDDDYKLFRIDDYMKLLKVIDKEFESSTNSKN